MGPSPEGGDSAGETGNLPAGWESEGKISGFQVSGEKDQKRCQKPALELAMDQVFCARIFYLLFNTSSNTSIPRSTRSRFAWLPM